jgi:hypothetical protein
MIKLRIRVIVNGYIFFIGAEFVCYAGALEKEGLKNVKGLVAFCVRAKLMKKTGITMVYIIYLCAGKFKIRQYE